MEILRYQRQDGAVPISEWLKSLRDIQAKVVIRRRLDRLSAGNFGSSKALRAGVSELKIDIGPGYRVYFSRQGQLIVLLLCGGDKGSQETDITNAIFYLEDWKKRQRASHD